MKSQCFYFFFIIFIIHIIYIFFERRLRNNYESIYLFTIQRTWFNHQHIWIKLKLYPINITSSTFLTPLRLIQNSCPGSISALLIRFRFHVRAISPLSLSLFPLTFHDPITSETACILQIAGTRASFSSRLATHMRVGNHNRGQL